MACQRSGVVLAAVASSFVSTGCGAGANERSETADDVEGDATPTKRPVDQLRSVATDLEKALDDLTAAIDGVDALLARVEQLPDKLSLDAGAVSAILQASFRAGKLRVDGAALEASAKRELSSIVKEMVSVKTKLEETPAAVARLLKLAAAAVAKVPVLAAQAQGSAMASAANPFGSAEDKAQAKADLEMLAGIQKDVTAKVMGLPAKLTGLPARAAKSMSRMLAAFGGGSDSTPEAATRCCASWRAFSKTSLPPNR